MFTILFIFLIDHTNSAQKVNVHFCCVFHKKHTPWGRCYDHNFLRVLPIFGEKVGVFLKKNNVMIKILHNLALFGVEKRQFFAIFIVENI
jgi:hypothetical protein